MRREMVAILFQEGGRFISSLLSLRNPKPKTKIESEPNRLQTPNPQTKASSVEAGCVPCALGHVGTCNGGLSEAMRFARSDGINSTEVIDRINHCLDELNIMEREDLTEEKLTLLPDWEKAIADDVLLFSRQTRHALEGVVSVEQLEQVTASTQTARKDIGRRYFRRRYPACRPRKSRDSRKGWMLR